MADEEAQTVSDDIVLWLLKYFFLNIFGISNIHVYKLPLDNQANVENQGNESVAITAVAVGFNPQISAAAPDQQWPPSLFTQIWSLGQKSPLKGQLWFQFTGH